MPLNTRHYGVMAIGAISTATVILGEVQHNIPTWSTFLVNNAIPAAITILDWIGARIKDAKGINSISVADITNILGILKSVKDGIPQIQTAPAKQG